MWLTGAQKFKKKHVTTKFISIIKHVMFCSVFFCFELQLKIVQSFLIYLLSSWSESDSGARSVGSRMWARMFESRLETNFWLDEVWISNDWKWSFSHPFIPLSNWLTRPRISGLGKYLLAFDCCWSKLVSQRSKECCIFIIVLCCFSVILPGFMKSFFWILVKFIFKVSCVGRSVITTSVYASFVKHAWNLILVLFTKLAILFIQWDIHLKKRAST